MLVCTKLRASSGSCWMTFAIDSVGCGSGLRGTIHKPVLVHFRPYNICFPRYDIVHPIFVKSTSHPASQSLTIDNKEWEARPGIICPWRALVGS